MAAPDMIPSTFAELAVAAAVVWGLYRLLTPLRRRAEKTILKWLDPTRADIVDAEVMPPERKNPKE
jgi:hypothetical protein